MLARTVAQVTFTFRILGRLETLVDGRRVDLSSRRERALLGVLLLNLGEVVSTEALIDSVWGERPPASARHLVHEYVSRIRGAFGDGSPIATRAPGTPSSAIVASSTPRGSPSSSAWRAPP
jgi:DNA-binding SARP family transcriptional activator